MQGIVQRADAIRKVLPAPKSAEAAEMLPQTDHVCKANVHAWILFMHQLRLPTQQATWMGAATSRLFSNSKSCMSAAAAGPHPEDCSSRAMMYSAGWLPQQGCCKHGLFQQHWGCCFA
jgi:hypothetical protein